MIYCLETGSHFEISIIQFGQKMFHKQNCDSKINEEQEAPSVQID